MSLDKFKENGYTYFRLYIRCPVCIEKGIQTPVTYWSHYNNNCYGDIYIGDNAFFKCTKCGHSAHIMHWGYNCPTHSNSQDEFVGAGLKAIAEAVSTAGQLVNDAGLEWLQTLLKNLKGATGGMR